MKILNDSMSSVEEKIADIPLPSTDERVVECTQEEIKCDNKNIKRKDALKPEMSQTLNANNV